MNSMLVGMVVLDMVVRHPCTGQKKKPGSDTKEDPEVLDRSLEYSSPGSIFTAGSNCDNNRRDLGGAN